MPARNIYNAEHSMLLKKSHTRRRRYSSKFDTRFGFSLHTRPQQFADVIGMYFVYSVHSAVAILAHTATRNDQPTNRRNRKVEMFCFFFFFTLIFTSCFSVVERCCRCGCGEPFLFWLLIHLITYARPSTTHTHTRRDFNDEWHGEKDE